MILLSEWIRACSVKQVKEGQLLGLTIKGMKILVANIDGNIRATSLICTHANADLSTGFLSSEGIRCPLHLSVFNLEDGKPQNLPAETPLRVYNVKIDGNEVYVEV